MGVRSSSFRLSPTSIRAIISGTILGGIHRLPDYLVETRAELISKVVVSDFAGFIFIVVACFVRVGVAVAF